MDFDPHYDEEGNKVLTEGAPEDPGEDMGYVPSFGFEGDSEPVLTATLALGGACSLLCVALVAPQRGTTPAKTAVALMGPLTLSVGVGAWLRSVVIPAADMGEGD